MSPERTIGETIRQARQERGLSQEDVSRETRLSLVVLRNLETDHFAELPGGLYVENAIRMLADFLDLDRGALMARYRDGRGELPTEEAQDNAERAIWVEEGVPETRVRGWQPGRRFWISVVLVILIAVLSLVFIRTWRSLPDLFGGGERDEPAPRNTAIIEEPVDSAPPAAIAEPTEEPSADAVPIPPAESPAMWQDGPVLPTQSSRETQLRRDAAMELLITAKDDCRVQVNMDGRRHLARAITPGGSWRLQAAYQVVLSVDDGGAITLELDGEPYPLPDTGRLRGQSLALRVDASREVDSP